MNFNQNLELTQSQKLVMTTQLKQSLSLLNMNRLEVEEEIKREAEENPLLEYEKTSEIDWEAYIKDMDNYNQKNRMEVNYNPDNDIDLENIIKESNNIYEHLHLQISLYKLNKKEMEVCEYIIDSLDEDGYLRVDEKEIIKQLDIDKDMFEDCMANIQQLEPSGVCARTLSECLIIQMNQLGLYNDILENIVFNDLELIANNKYKDISKKYNISIEQCSNLIRLIKSLDPKPGRCCSIEKSVYVNPDAIVEKIDNEFIVYINENDGFKLRINNFYKEILKNSQSDESAKNFIKEKLNSAAGLMKNIENRKTTVLRVAEEIVKFQNDFFIKGKKHIKPMRMKDIAETLEFHESTISRTVNGKYMLTPLGMFEFKYFFSSALENSDNSTTSSTSIKMIIEEIINMENKKKPLSDDNIAKMLKDRGINVARRTIAKYREELGILSSSRRKTF
ncbi:RNA polymerase factor sigma-54 [Romboutsia sp.]|uniref:RNA polymerase factor sigma-54 n=1 Tax=Romboutsia sp. TaxID=1965302 RepID=UPI003F33AF47